MVVMVPWWRWGWWPLGGDGGDDPLVAVVIMVPWWRWSLDSDGDGGPVAAMGMVAPCCLWDVPAFVPCCAAFRPYFN